MDIIKVLRLNSNHTQASPTALGLIHRLFILVFLGSLFSTILPHTTYAGPMVRPPTVPVLIFDLSDQSYQNYLAGQSLELSDQNSQQSFQKEILRKQQLTQALEKYLEEAGSPLAEYSSTLVTMRNWKKIVALSNAESSMCKNYYVEKANCWGVGGSDLWDFGDNLGQGVIAMNHFLNNYPLRSTVKYAQMSFEDMNGFYKQPAKDHWLWNNQIIFDDLTHIENSL